MKSVKQTSDSLVGALCKEIEYMSVRSTNISNSLRTCQNKELEKRLKIELKNIKNKSSSILDIANELSHKSYYIDDLSIKLLLEISQRSISRISR